MTTTPIRPFAMIAVTFMCGLIYEAGCVFWVHHSEAHHIGQAVAFSGLNAAVTIVGVEAFLKSHACKVAYVVGFCAGTFLALSFG